MQLNRPAVPAHSAPANEGTFVLPLRVYYEDTDAAGVVYYANYLRFCERARTEWLRRFGLAQQAMLDEAGIAFVVRSVRADYLRPARLDDALQVLTRVEQLRRASILFRQDVQRGSETLFTASVLVACIDWQRHKPVQIPPSLYHRLESRA